MMNEVKDYDPMIDMFIDCLANNCPKNKERIEKYVVHRKLFGREAAKRIYPEVHYIQIADPMLKDLWKNFLKTVDSL